MTLLRTVLVIEQTGSRVVIYKQELGKETLFSSTSIKGTLQRLQDFLESNQRELTLVEALAPSRIKTRKLADQW